MAYDGAVRCLGWYEQNRKLPGGGFWCADCVGDRQWESGYDESPRWDGFEDNRTPAACADLCGQMGMSYDAMAGMAESLGRTDQAHRWRRQSSCMSFT